MAYSSRIRQLREDGILDKLERKHFGMMKNQVCAPDRHVTQSALSVVDVWPVFVVLGGGLALGWLVLLIEHVVHIVHGYLQSGSTCETEVMQLPSNL